MKTSLVTATTGWSHYPGTVAIDMGLLPSIALAADALPQRAEFHRYETMMNRSFAVATAVPVTTPDLGNALYIANVRCPNEKYVVTLTSVTQKNFKREVPVNGQMNAALTTSISTYVPRTH